MPPSLDSCRECGGPGESSDACRAAFDALLAFEFENPAAFGPVHHFTVACYYLQHPSGHTAAVLRAWRELIADSLDGRAAPSDLLERARRRFDGAERVRDAEGRPPTWWPRTWPLTVHDVVPPGTTPTPALHIERVRRWAAAIRATLDGLAPEGL